MFRADGTYVNLLSIHRVKSRGVASVYIIITDFNPLDRKNKHIKMRTVGSDHIWENPPLINVHKYGAQRIDKD